MHFKNKPILLLTLLFLILAMQFGSSQATCEGSGYMGKFQQDSNVTITQTCPTCTFINITVSDPDSIIVFNNTAMNFSNSIFTFDGNSTISSKLGIYFVQGISNLDNPFKSCYIVTNIATELTIQESIIYIILTISVFLMFLLCFWGGVGLPARNRRNELGRVISVEIMKYPKLGCMFLSYAFFTWFINILLTISVNFVTLSQYEGFFTMIFNFLLAGLYAFFVATVVIFFILAARDLKLQDFLTRGIQPR